MIVRSFGAQSITFWEKRQTQLHHLFNHKAHSLQNLNDFANYFNDFFIGKISKVRHDMPATNTDTTYPRITDQIMKDKHCNFEFRKVSVEEVKHYCCLSTIISHRRLTTWMENY
jgi:hypothetical protein